MSGSTSRLVEPILDCRSVTKRYGGLTAVDSVSFSVGRAEVFGVIGPNGAGKTTLFDVISGVSSASGGEIVFCGRDVTRLSTSKIACLGLQRTFQIPMAFGDLTVRENVQVGALFAGRRPRAGLSGDLPTGVCDILTSCRLDHLAGVRAGPLPVLMRKRLMVATALAARPSLLMLDEPMGGLNHDERAEMLDLLRDLNRMGLSLLLIEHVLTALLQVAQRVMVLDQGRSIFEGSPQEAVRDPEALRVYLGQEADQFNRGAAAAGERA